MTMLASAKEFQVLRHKILNDFLMSQGGHKSVSRATNPQKRRLRGPQASEQKKFKANAATKSVQETIKKSNRGHALNRHKMNNNLLLLKDDMSCLIKKLCATHTRSANQT